MKKVLLVLVTIVISGIGYAQNFTPLWPSGRMPNSKGLQLRDSIVNDRIIQVGVPGFYSFFPAKEENTGAAILIFPGGGYHHLTYDLGGFQLAKWFNSMGISAFVVNYRLPTSPDLVHCELGPLQDAQRAMRIIRANAAKWKIDPAKIGVQGSSAGGHVAAMMGCLKDDVSRINDSLDKISFQADFMILVSPVISMGVNAHKGSKENFLGKNPSKEMTDKYSMELQVNSTTPRCFIADAFNDKTVPPINSLLFYQALLEKNISTSFHVFPQGAHSIGLTNNPGSTVLWKSLLEAWMKEMQFTEH
ncbi:alpha/beta hydrolase [Pinibacter soli]|uniref:Alpha/beta hydrolase n=1 Tax=Pinibacter soli TaxID=3044211 RepID=A0ABT6R9P3_9BACT|nr:alpha/beta hydrolase [Pinibacter soli]MDI3319228.1 alpha/beta hydrolase [Pinibacter soli]